MLYYKYYLFCAISFVSVSQVLQPTIPSCFNPLAAWYLITAFLVLFPKTPSIFPALYPKKFKAS